MRLFKHIHAVTFDVGGTLIETWPSVGHIYAHTAAEFGVKSLEPEALTRQFREAWQTKSDFDYSHGSWYELVRRTFGKRAVELPGEFFPAVFARFEQPDAWRIHDDVLPTLDALASKDVRLAIVSNWDSRLRPLLKRLGLSSYFEIIIPSCEVAFHKPSPVLFEEVIRKLSLPPEEILHVGDHFLEDVEGARGAGMNAMHLIRNGERKAEHEILSLEEVPAIIDRSGYRMLAAG